MNHLFVIALELFWVTSVGLEIMSTPNFYPALIVCYEPRIHFLSVTSTSFCSA